MPYGSRSTVLLVEADPSLRRLITLGLEYHGMHVIEAGSLAELSAPAGPAPELLVLDIDQGIRCDWSLLEATQATPSLAGLPIVVLAWEQLPVESGDQDTLPEYVTCLAKPFDARALHALTERLLANRVVQEERVLLAQTRTLAPSPSLCPIIMAAGLLLVIIGVLVQLLLSGVGLLIVLATVLYWTLGTKPEAQRVAPALAGQFSN
ncbi:MAG: hypothetical protein M3Y81_09960 [Chloroflexota bacterium]|nr:hypothetical protein [Chloroflexota bacterium]